MLTLLKITFLVLKVKLTKERFFTFDQWGSYIKNADSSAMSQINMFFFMLFPVWSSRMASLGQGGSQLCQPIPQREIVKAQVIYKVGCES